MGNLLTKKASSKVAPEPLKPSSAPANLQGLDGVEPGSNQRALQQRPLSTPANVSVLASGLGDAQVAEAVQAAKEGLIVETPKPLLVAITENKEPEEAAPQEPPALEAQPPVPADTQHSPETASAKQPCAASPNGKTLPKRIDVIGQQSDGSGLAGCMKAVIHIPDAVKHWTQVLPERVVRSLHSSDWKDREQGLTSTARTLATLCSAAANPGATQQAQGAALQGFHIACEILQIMLREKVVPLFHSSLDLLHKVLAIFAAPSSSGTSVSQQQPQGLVPATTLREGMVGLVPLLVRRCGNANARINESAMQALLALATCPGLGGLFLGPFLLDPATLPSASASSAAAAAATVASASQTPAATSPAAPSSSSRADKGVVAQAAQLCARLSLVADILGMAVEKQLLGKADCCPSTASSSQGSGSAAGCDGLEESAVLGLCQLGLSHSDERARQAAAAALVQLHCCKRMHSEGSSPSSKAPVKAARGLAAVNADERVAVACASKVLPEAVEGARLKLPGPGLQPETCVGPIKQALVQVLSRKFAEADEMLSNGTFVGSALLGVRSTRGKAAAAGASPSLLEAGSLRLAGKQLPPLAIAAPFIKPVLGSSHGMTSGSSGAPSWRQGSGAAEPEPHTPSSPSVTGRGASRGGQPRSRLGLGTPPTADQRALSPPTSSPPAPGTSDLAGSSGSGSRALSPALGSARQALLTTLRGSKVSPLPASPSAAAGAEARAGTPSKVSEASLRSAARRQAAAPSSPARLPASLQGLQGSRCTSPAQPGRSGVSISASSHGQGLPARMLAGVGSPSGSMPRMGVLDDADEQLIDYFCSKDMGVVDAC
ncbi:hypothetical protein QJQ45_019198 [Haematococcus lacustris]|nr:hypothetical protein QJQ45_019198 [Haematococcus lacustris]